MPIKVQTRKRGNVGYVVTLFININLTHKNSHGFLSKQTIEQTGDSQPHFQLLGVNPMQGSKIFEQFG